MSWWVGEMELIETTDGRGGFHRARRGSDGAPTAVRIAGRESAGLLRREAAVNGDVEHHHLAKVSGVVTADEWSVLVLAPPLAFGLDELTRPGGLPPGEIVTALIPVTWALAAVHTAGLAHGDVCPTNIWFDPAGRPVLAGLGRTQAVAESGDPATFHPAHLAPERARGGSSDAAADLFGLGSTLLACLTGRSAWPADDVHDVLVQSTVGQWPDAGLDHKDPERVALAALARRLLDADPGRRGTARQAATDLAAAARPRPVTAPPDLTFRSTDSAGPTVPLAPPSAGTTGSAGYDTPPGRPPSGQRSTATAPRHAAPRHGSGRRPVELRSSAPRASIGRRRWWRIGVGVASGTSVLVVAAVTGLLWAKWSGPSAGDAAPVALTMSAAPLTVHPASTEPARLPASVPPLSTPASPVSSAVVVQPTSTSPAAASSTQPRSASAGTATAATVNWRAVMQNLDQARAAAIVERSPGRLDRVYSDGSADRAGDVALIQSLLSAHTKVAGAAHSITRVVIVSAASGRVRLTVTDSLPAYPVLDETGATVGMTAVRPSSAHRVDLTAVADGWRIVDIREPS